MPDFAEYCRQLESYLCRKNGGHLVRIVGPAFERVRGWADLGVPLTIACRGIDRYCERQQAAGPRRRPVRIEFCEADILAVFDDWRRAVGVVQEAGADSAAPATRQPALAAHLERIVARLIGPAAAVARARGAHRRDPPRARSAGGRVAERPRRCPCGDPRSVDELDDELMALARADVDPAAVASVRREAEQELGPRRAHAGRGAVAGPRRHVQRLVRESLALPTIRYEWTSGLLGDEIELAIEKAAAGGRMIARHDGQVVLVAGTVPGERVRARIERADRRLAFAQVVEIKEASPDRRAAFADPLCGGCVFSHIAYPRQLDLKREIVLDAFQRIGRMTLDPSLVVASSPDGGYRMRARLHVRAAASASIARARTRCATPQLRDNSPNPRSRRRSGGRDASSAPAACHVRRAHREHRGRRARAVHRRHRRHASRSTRGRRCRRSAGAGCAVHRDAVVDGRRRRAAGLGSARGADERPCARRFLRRHPESFFQANRFLVPTLVAEVVDPFAANARSISTRALGSSRSRSRQRAGGEHGGRGRPLQRRRSPANAAPWRSADARARQRRGLPPASRDSASTRIVDPPRTGISPEAIGGSSRDERRGWSTCRAIRRRWPGREEAAGRRLRAESLRGFDLFPNTAHVETLGSSTYFDRAEAGASRPGACFE